MALNVINQVLSHKTQVDRLTLKHLTFPLMKEFAFVLTPQINQRRCLSDLRKHIIQLFTAYLSDDSKSKVATPARLMTNILKPVVVVWTY